MLRFGPSALQQFASRSRMSTCGPGAVIRNPARTYVRFARKCGHPRLFLNRSKADQVASRLIWPGLGLCCRLRSNPTRAALAKSCR